MLSSEILEKQFGPTQVEVLFQDSRFRIIRTKVAASGQVLEVSWVAFSASGVKAYPDIHKAIAGGESMGKAFTDAGIAFARDTTSVSRCALPPIFDEHFADNRPATVVEVSILVGPDKLPYGRVLEVYSPVVEWPEQPSLPEEELASALSEFAAFLQRLRTDASPDMPI